MSICSIHLIPKEDCPMCQATPWDLLDITQKEYEGMVNDAASEGTLTCPLCNFDGMYKKTCRISDNKYICPCCGKYFELTNEQ